MKTTHHLTILGVLIVALVCSCKKYDDGPRLSLRTKKSRVANEWKYDQVIAPNGQNITAQYANSSLELTKDGEYVDASSPSYAITGTWKFAGDKEDIVLTPNDNSASTLLHITRLKSKELWFTIEDFNGIYEYQMIPK